MDRIKNITKMILKREPFTLTIQRKGEKDEVIEFKDYLQLADFARFVQIYKLDDLVEFEDEKREE